MKCELIIIVFLFSVCSGQDIQQENISCTYLNSNNISLRVYNNGQISIPGDSTAAMEYPKSSGKYVLNQSGLLYGAKYDGQIRVGGSTAFSGLIPGRILENGLAEEPSLDNVRIYRVRPDWQNCSLEDEIRDEKISEEKIRAQYEKDWNEWPAELGAPFVDMNNDGIYQPGIDIPGKKGLDQTLWYVCNDLDENKTVSLYGSLPLGIELQVTLGAFSGDEAENNLILRWYKIINRSKYSLQDMYLSYWMDPDIGNKNDDYIGCDSVLNLAYAYNCNNADEIFKATPPCYAAIFLQGPYVDGNANDIALFEGEQLSGKKNLNMTIFTAYMENHPVFIEPDFGSYIGSLEYYNYFSGRFSTMSHTYAPAYPFSGDPVTRTGWLDGEPNFPGGDRKMLMVSGPFDLVEGEAQEIVIAELVAGNLPNVLNIDAVDLMKFYARQVNYRWLITGVEQSEACQNFYLRQNYPNPFNPITIIEFNLPEKAFMKCEVYNILGKKIATLVDREMPAGSQRVLFNASHLASGTYFYVIRTNKYTETKKMLLVK